MRSKGKLVSWTNDKAFGFIAPNGGGNQVFIHKSAFSNRQRIPKVNDIVTFSITKDKQGRDCATAATFSGEKLKRKQSHKVSKFSVYLSVSFIGLILVNVTIEVVPIKLLLIYLGVSITTFIVYAFDKSKAQRGAWRTSESTLHILALFGGWPGAAIAQQTLRHKNQKKEFRFAFWLTVILNCSAFVWLISPNGVSILRMLSSL